MLLKNNILIPFWAEFFPDISCGFTLPVFGNMALTRKSITKKSTTVENRIELLKILQFNKNNTFYPHLIHSDIVLDVTKEDAGKGFAFLDDAIQGDSALTGEKGIMLAVTWADCIPVLLYDKQSGWIAAIHSGWKGTLKNITSKTINKLYEKNIHRDNLYAAVGPGIKECCYEVGHDLVNAFKKTELKKFFIKRNNKYFFNLSNAVLYQIMQSGVKRENIDYSEKCTCCSDSPLFFSCRKDKEFFEAQAAFIGKK